jgi:hypothetical protein
VILYCACSVYSHTVVMRVMCILSSHSTGTVSAVATIDVAMPVATILAPDAGHACAVANRSACSDTIEK